MLRAEKLPLALGPPFGLMLEVLPLHIPLPAKIAPICSNPCTSMTIPSAPMMNFVCESQNQSAWKRVTIAGRLWRKLTPSPPTTTR